MASYTLFDGARRLAAGPLDVVVRAGKAAFDGSRTSRILIFDDATGEQIDVDYSGAEADVVRAVAVRLRMAAAAAGTAAATSPTGTAAASATADAGSATTRKPGRPRLGVVAREVTLLPRHWQWLNGQPGGASVALRRLVDEARRTSVDRDRVRRAQEVTYRVMVALGGDLPGFEEAIRALFAGEASRFTARVQDWPADVRAYVHTLAADAFPEATS